MAFWSRKKENSKTEAHSEDSPPPRAKRHPAVEAHLGHQQGPASSQDTENVPVALRNVRNIIAIASGKGGVGKSTLTANLAAALVHSGARVGVLDADIYGPTQPGLLGSSSQKAQVEEGLLAPVKRHGISFMSMGLVMEKEGPVVWRAPMATRAVQQFLNGVHWGELDYLLIDLPPGTGDVQLTLAQQARLSGAVIVTTPQEVAVGIAKKGLAMLRQLNVPILGVVENMSGLCCESCGHETHLFGRGGGEKLARDEVVPFLGAIPLDLDIVQSGESGVPVVAKGESSRSARSFLELASGFVAQLEERRRTESGGEPAQVELGPSGDLRIRWSDGREEAVTSFRLRAECGCANCVDENTGKRTLDSSEIDPAVAILSIAPVGRYAITAQFSDGHGTGIYPFKRLKELCEKYGTERQAPRPAASSRTPGDLKQGIETLLTKEINPSIASHGGRIELVDVQGDKVFLRMSGGCQGCSSAKLTLRQGVERALRARFPEVSEVIDTTDHSQGVNPYYR